MQGSENIKKRDQLLDAIKGLAIILVVLGHTLQSCVPDFDHNVVFRLIYSFHMPLFFFLSGMVAILSVEKKGSWSIFKSKFTTLVIPFICWYFFAAYWITGSFKTIPISEYTLRLIKSPDYGLWFLWVLFLCFMVYILFRLLRDFLFRFVKKYSLLVELGVIVLLICLVRKIPVNLFGKGLLGDFLPYFFAGYFIAKYKDSLKRWKVLFQELSFVFYPILVFFWVRTEPPLWLQYFPQNLQVHLEKGYRYLVAFMGISIVFAIMEKVKQEKINTVLAWFGMVSLDIYVSHQLFLSWTVGSGMIQYALTFFCSISIALLLSFCILRKSKILSFLFLGKLGVKRKETPEAAQ